MTERLRQRREYLGKVHVAVILSIGLLAVSGAANAGMIVSVTNNGNVDVYGANVDILLNNGTRVLVGEGAIGFPIIGGFFICGSEISFSNLLLPGETAQTPFALEELAPDATVGSVSVSGQIVDTRGGFLATSSVTLGPATTVVPYDDEFSGFVFKGQFTFAEVPEPSFLFVLGPVLLFAIAYSQKLRARGQISLDQVEQDDTELEEKTR